MIFDSDGNPEEFIFLDVNPKYEEITHLKKNNIINKRGREVIPNIEAKWYLIYGEVAKTGKPIQVIDHSEYLDKYWDIRAYSTGGNKFAVAMSDITGKIKAEKEILKAKNEAERYLDMAGSMFVSLNTRGEIVLLNQKAVEVMGYDISEVLGKNWFDLCIPQKISMKVKEVFEKIMRGNLEGIEHFENDIITKSGELKTISWNNSYIRNDEGEITYLLSSGNDVTEIKKTRTKLIKSEEMYRGLVNTINSGVAIYQVENDGKSGSDYIIKQFNKLSLEHEGLTEEQVIGKSLKDIRPNIDEYGLIEVFRNVWKTGEPAFYPAKIYIDENFSNYYENRVFKLPSGEIVAIYDDVTEKENTSDKLKESIERFNLAMNASQDGLFDWNLITNEIYYSPGWKSMVGYKEDELPNDFSVWEALTDPLDVKDSWDLLNKVINKELPRFYKEFKMKHKDGHWIDVLSRADAIFNDQGKAVRMIGTHVDITERKQILAELEKHKKQLEELVAERTKELEEKNQRLENLNKLFVGREFRIKELRDQVRELEKRDNFDK